MPEPSQHISNTLSLSTYTISASLMVGEAWNFLNDNAGAIGACIAILTFITNIFFQIRRDRKWEKQNDRY